MGFVLVRLGKGLVLYIEYEENFYFEKLKRDC